MPQITNYNWCESCVQLTPADNCSACGKDIRPVVKYRARKSDPATAHDGVASIGASVSKHRQSVLALSYPDTGLNYREIAEAAGIYPTTCSRVITTLVREGSLRRIGTQGRCGLYVKAA